MKGWKGDKIPTKEEWQVKLFEHMELAKITEKIRHWSTLKFNNEWDIYRLYLKEHCPHIKALTNSCNNIRQKEHKQHLIQVKFVEK